MTYRDYSEAWLLKTATGDYASSKEDNLTCHCCGKGHIVSKPLISCYVDHVYTQQEKAVWLCVLCLKHTLKMDPAHLEGHRRAHRAYHNERVLAHLLSPLRGELSAHIEAVPYLRKFMEYVARREIVPRRLLTLTSHYVRDHKR